MRLHKYTGPGASNDCQIYSVVVVLKQPINHFTKMHSKTHRNNIILLYMKMKSCV